MSQDETDRTGKPNENDVGTTPSRLTSASRPTTSPTSRRTGAISRRDIRSFGPPLIENASDPQRRTH